MNNPVIYQAGGALLVIAFLVFLFLSAKSWRIVHVLLTLCVFGTALWFTVLAAGALQARYEWKTKHEKLSKELDEEKEAVSKLLHGDLAEVRQTTDSIRSVRGKLSRALVDRGRVWRQASPTAVNGNQITVSTVPPGVEEANATPNQIEPQTVVYAFAEEEHPSGELGKIPWLYLGEFTATAATPTSVTLMPTMRLDAVQTNAVVNSVGQTWSLYEIVPRDDHRAFALEPDYRPDLGQEGDPIFGEMDAEALDSLFSKSQQLYLNWRNTITQQTTGEQQAAAQRILASLQQRLTDALQQYKRDGQRASDEDLEENTWVKVRFLKKHSVPVDASAAQGAINSTDYFDSNGMAVVTALQREDGQPAEFEPDDLAVFHKAKADELVASGICAAIEPVFVRPLNDFGPALHERSSEMARLES